MKKFLAILVGLSAASWAKPISLLSKPLEIDKKFRIEKAEATLSQDKKWSRAKVLFTVRNISGRSLKMGTFEVKSQDEPWFGFELGLPAEAKAKLMRGTSLGPIRSKPIAPNEVFTVEPSLGLPGKLTFTWIQLTYDPYFGSKKKRVITGQIPLPRP